MKLSTPFKKKKQHLGEKVVPVSILTRTTVDRKSNHIKVNILCLGCNEVHFFSLPEVCFLIDEKRTLKRLFYALSVLSVGREIMFPKSDFVSISH